MSHQVDPLAVTRALASDPAVAVRCALPALVQAWCLAAGCDAAEVVANVRAGAVARLGGGARRRAAAVLDLAVAATLTEPWVAAPVPGRRDLRACVRTLERATAQRDVRRWAVVLVIGAVVLAGLGVHVLAERGVARRTSWAATHYADPSFSGATTSVLTTELSAAGPAPSSSRFETCLELDRPTEVAFQLVAGGGAALYVDDVSVVIDWTGLPGPRTRGARVPLTAGTHRLRIDLYRADPDSGVHLLASVDGGAPRALDHASPCAERTP